ncbi:MAG: hypothetical protein O6950_03915 [Gammaproteobacteria bacterium]|nr:hypothetical protein [Gammaproteobacteria bacterium]
MPVESVIMGLLAIIAMAEPNPEESAPPPDTELLEFLGSWETASGEWLDPAVFADDEAEEDNAPRGTGKHER